MTFEEWAQDTGIYPNALSWDVYKSCWDASRTQALFEAANRAGDAANEGEKHERMIKAAAAISILYPDRTADWDKLKAIIEEAQG